MCVLSVHHSSSKYMVSISGFVSSCDREGGLLFRVGGKGQKGDG